MTSTVYPDRHIPLGYKRPSPFVFRRFFELGLEESASPFLNLRAQKISKNLALKTAIFSALMLCFSYTLSFIPSCRPLAEATLMSVYVVAGIPSLIAAVEDVVLRLEINIDVLMTVAAFAALFLGNGFEGALLLVLFSLSGALEDTVTLRAKSSLRTLHHLVPTKALVIADDGRESERAVQDIEPGMRIFVPAGEIIPLDGVVEEGTSTMSFAHLTGENLPQRKIPGDRVPSGARLVEGSLTIKVTHTSGESTVAKIVQLIIKAQETKPRLARWFDHFSRGYAVSIIFLAFLFCFAFPFIEGIAYLGREGSIYRSLAFLIAASPCALILAVPIAYLSVLSTCAKRGIVLKGGIVIDALNDCECIAFDKTGTLTLGELTLDRIESIAATIDPAVALAVASSLERHSTHPIAKAVVASTGYEMALKFPTQEVKVIPGSGVEGTVQIGAIPYDAFVGIPAVVLARVAARSDQLKDAIARAEKETMVVAAMCIGEEVFLLTFKDTPRPFVKEMLASLKAKGKKILMLTGDRATNARVVAEHLGIDAFYADLRPEDKLEKITELSKTGLAMVGDGINDAPALARATVGIAMGRVGSATAQEVADVILLNDSVELLDWLFTKAEKTKRIVVQNLVLAISVILFTSIPAICGYVPLWLAVILHEGGTVLVGLNALRLLR